MNIVSILENYTFHASDWEIYDARISIPPLSFGSDAINPHTQYSNPLLIFRKNGIKGVGVSFTLGDGNDLLCACVKKILIQLEGISIGELFEKEGYFFEFFANPKQLRWLSPYSGVAYMAAGAILNTLLDWAAKNLKLPLWKALCIEPSENLLKFCSTRQYDPFLKFNDIRENLDNGLIGIEDRVREVETSGLPVYFTTWIGDSPENIVKNIEEIHKNKGINHFKLKISGDVNLTTSRIDYILGKLAGRNFKFYADANQSLNYESAIEICRMLDSRNFVWLEEPFAPDNFRLHRMLIEALRSESNNLEIVTGENCPNSHTAIEFIQSMGCHRFQIDACRQMSISDTLPILVAARLKGVEIVPHAGGAGLDELVTHLTAFNYCRICFEKPLQSSLTEYVGFCSRYFESPTKVVSGSAIAPSQAGYINDVSTLVYDALSNSSEIKWLEY